MTSRRAIWTLAMLAIAWAAALPAAALVAATSGGATPESPAALLAHAVYAVARLVCHQRVERSFAWGSAAWPVCARCAGVYIGAAAGSVAALLLAARAARLPAAAGVRTVLVVAAIPALASVAYEWATGDVPANGLRAATGAIAGAPCAALLGLFVAERPAPRRPPEAGAGMR